MVVIFRRGDVTVRETPTRELGGPAVDVHAGEYGQATLDAPEVVELRDELTEWLRRVGRDS